MIGGVIGAIAGGFVGLGVCIVISGRLVPDLSGSQVGVVILMTACAGAVWGAS